MILSMMQEFLFLVKEIGIYILNQLIHKQKASNDLNCISLVGPTKDLTSVNLAADTHGGNKH